jgi:hypothetical protein
MDILQQVISGMNKEEVRFFKLYEAGLTGEDRKDLHLFNFIRLHGENYDEEKIFKKLYPGGEKNPFYRLRNRLLADVSKSLSLQHYDSDESIGSLNMLSLARIFLLKNQTEAAHYFLKRAEVKALRCGNHELLDIIYGDFIRLSHEKTAINPEVFIKKRKDNRQNIELLRQIDDILAVVTYKLKITQNFSPEKNPVLNVLQQTVTRISKDKKLLRSPMLRFRMYYSVSQILLQRRDYASLESYLLKVYPEFEKEKLFTRNNHDTKLQMLTYIVNALFKTGKYPLSLQYAEVLRKNMEAFHHLLYDKYFFFYYNSLVINYSRLNPDKAVSILEDLKDNDKIRQNGFYSVFVYLNLVVLYFDKKEYKTAIRNLNKLYLLDAYKTTDVSIRFRIAMAELIIRYELKDFELLEYKIKRAQKEFRKYLALAGNRKDRDFIRLLKTVIHSPDIRRDEKVIKQVRKFLSIVRQNKSEDQEIIEYNTWLESLPLKSKVSI